MVMHTTVSTEGLTPPVIAIPPEAASALGALFFYPNPDVLIWEGFFDVTLSAEEVVSSARRIVRVLDIMDIDKRRPQ